MVFDGIAWYSMVLQAITWYLMVFNNIRWYCMVFDGIAGYYMVFIGISPWLTLNYLNFPQVTLFTLIYSIIHCGFPQDFPKISPRFPQDFPKMVLHGIRWYCTLLHGIHWYFTLINLKLSKFFSSYLDLPWFIQFTKIYPNLPPWFPQDFP